MDAPAGAARDLGGLLLHGFGRLIAGDYAAVAEPMRQALAKAAGPAVLEGVIPEPPAAAPGPGPGPGPGLSDALHRALADVTAQDEDARLAARAERYRHLGGPR